MRVVKKEDGYHTWGISLSSRGEENENFMLVWLGRIVYTIYFDWFILKPYFYTWKYNGETYDNMIAAKRISFTVHTGREDGFIAFDYGADNDFLMSNDGGKNIAHIPTISKTWWIPWNQNTFVKHEMLNMDGTVFATIDNKARQDALIECVEPWNYPNHERMKFTFYDGYDNSLVTATVYRERKVWTRGTGWMSWLKYFTKNITHDDLSLNFDKEVGPKKESWKGGVTGSSISVKKYESAHGACVRYCKENGHTFVDFVSDTKGNRIFKNIVTPPRVHEDAKDANTGKGSVL